LNYQELENQFFENLKKLYSIEEIRTLIRYGYAEHSSLAYPIILADKKQLISATERTSFQNYLSQLQSGIPYQYVVGGAEFMGRIFSVGPGVLIPRPETEELASWIIEDHQLVDHSFTLLDLGTGSGCIAVSLALELPKSAVIAIDVSESALEFARYNNDRYAANVLIRNGDILNESLKLNSDIIVSNPPYVRLLEKELMSCIVTDAEPHTALFVPEEDPLIFYRAIARIFEKSTAHSLYLECNQYLKEETIALFDSFNSCVPRDDFRGNFRMLKVMK
jgi:release factor glutamine methyltransferase